MLEQESYLPTEDSILQEIEEYKTAYAKDNDTLEDGWQGQYFNNFLLMANPRSPFRKFALEDTRKNLTTMELLDYTAEQGKASGHSHRYLHSTQESHVADIDAAIKAAGVNIEESLKIREERSSNAEMYALPGWQEAYVTLRLQGYNHKDITG